MNERNRFDPTSWFVHTCLSILGGAIALSVAGHLLAQAWPWLLVFAGIGIAGVLFLRLLAQLWRGWRQPW